MTTDEQTFSEHRKLLFAIAYRLLGSAADAEDVVQDAWFKWSGADRSQVSDPKAYLARIVSNLAMDRLRSTRRQRETYVGPWLPEPILTEADASEDVAVAESVSVAMLVVLETLSPLERAVFVLKEVFDFSYAEIADAVDRSESAVRQAAPPRPQPHPGAATALRDRPRQEARGHRAVLRRHHRRRHQRADGTARARTSRCGPTAAARSGRRCGRSSVWTRSSGGSPARASRPYEGVEIGDMSAEVVEINGAPGVVISGAGRVIATLTVDLDADGRIVTIHNVANPDKLHAIADGVDARSELA